METQMKPHFKKLFLLFAIATLFLTGCGSSGGSSNPVSTIPVEYVALNGTLKAPDSIESTLVASLLQNTDSQVRNAFASATVYVNGTPVTATLNALNSNPQWPLRLTNVPKSANGKYRIEVVAGRINLKSWITDSEKDSFKIDLQTTAAAMLSDKSGIEQNILLATYTSFVSGIQSSLESACLKSALNLTGSIVTDASVTQIITLNKGYIDQATGFTPEAKLAFLNKENDLDGDGNIDLKIEQNIDGDRIRFYTVLSSATSLLAGIDNMSGYTNERLLQDFKGSLTTTTRTFDKNGSKFALGLYFKKSASSDQYLKLFVRKINLEGGSFKGVIAEYDFVQAATSAISTGTKTLMIAGTPAAEGTVVATNFLSDSTEASPYMFSFISTEKGIGCNSGDIRMVRAIDGKPELANLSYAETYLDGGGNYYLNTTDALKAVYKERTVEVGDVFSAYFPRTKNYAIFKIKWIGNDRITLDYTVNSAENEPRF
jgi:hypothetical protein